MRTSFEYKIDTGVRVRVLKSSIFLKGSKNSATGYGLIANPNRIDQARLKRGIKQLELSFKQLRNFKKNLRARKITFV